MYSAEIVEKRLWAAKKAGHTYNRLPVSRSLEISRNLEQLRRAPNGSLLPDGELTRALDAREQEFIMSERLLCKLDAEYFISRYYVIERDPGVGVESGVGPARLLESQYRIIELLGRREEVCHAEKAKYGRTDGILAYIHKVRQVAATATSRALTLHRMLFWPGTRAFAATLKDGPQGTGELYKRDLLAVENLVFWLKPNVYPNVKDEEIGFEAPLQTRLSYQAENTQQGIGTGSQIDCSHLTEVALWNWPHRIRYSFLPSIPKALSTLHIQESTSSGKGGYWAEISEGCRQRRTGFESYIYIFIPWYLNRTKYVGNPPDDWMPLEHTVKHAELIERTSPEFCDGVTYHPSRDQLYWWEKTRALHALNSELAAFLANFAATPEQSFTNWAAGALPVELIEQMETEVRQPRSYSVEVQV